ncbi:hypothetical protein HGB13_01320 [bacterium]|nr:hypothetical protein [bacterium]
MSNYKLKDIIIIVVAALIFMAAIVFIMDSSGGKDKSKSTASATELVSEPDFTTSYDEETYNKISKFNIFSISDVQAVCKGNLFSIETPLAPDQQCYALEQLGLKYTTEEALNESDPEIVNRNNTRKDIVEA